MLLLDAVLRVSKATPPDGPLSKRGTYEGGRYVIEVPEGWNGGLVLFAHGFRGTSHSSMATYLAERG